ncbi:electron transfer flavoprotein subunit alpha/FixB family protein [Legionella pneumophila]|uniref:Electron transfer flavoprotein subunit alpha n=1 Tax=Legionella pneumophila subsp. pascullei TaxID=91890 RepID=A0AAX2ITN6_LEGPN|nr:FAD-binding protein [Legionella pneumophila]AMP90370.1 electron transfer flavoprotein subunit alpha [Legionella pneumophila subsp. pascullei]AMP91962.1 electron transfer flavoprotein subunit beta [Legionella pneumophila subsp. pascullei]AMP94928.1 electron transfer flavoprotein subunit beta [Legionella pneumophila subsp. pascullei]SQG89785.1 electron transfer flavoprotein, alpha subuni [Legionella pneumophila subsp. pascullei]VEH05403.1 electron transfer flavoprotein, alpha subuni [Legionel
MGTLVLVEHNNQQLHPATRNTLSAAIELGDKITLLVVGYQCHSVAEEAARLEGVQAVLHVDNPCYEYQLAEPVSDLVVSFAHSFSAILAPSSTFGKNILPRVAAQLDVTQISDVSKIINSDTFEHPVYAGNAIETVRVLDPLKVMTIRTTAFDPITSNQEACCIESIDKEFEAKGSQFIRHELSKSERPDLGSAKIVVSGGRGLQSAEKFKLIEELADALGAAVGASRAAVDAGFVPNDYQVGQTGKVVAPMLYIAVGISGAVQHLAGMKDSKVIVAINKDADAPIFQIANYGLVGDLFELVPQLIEQLKNR